MNPVGRSTCPRSGAIWWRWRAANYTLFLQSTSGEIYVVQPLQSGDYLYLDTYDEGGVASVIQREP